MYQKESKYHTPVRNFTSFLCLNPCFHSISCAKCFPTTDKSSRSPFYTSVPTPNISLPIFPLLTNGTAIYPGPQAANEKSYFLLSFSLSLSIINSLLLSSSVKSKSPQLPGSTRIPERRFVRELRPDMNK